MKRKPEQQAGAAVERLRERGPRPGTTPSAREIASWLTERIAEELGVDRAEIRSDVPFERYGLDSRIIAAIGGDLEDWLQRRLEPMLMWDYPTIEQVSEQLCGSEVRRDVAGRCAS